MRNSCRHYLEIMTISIIDQVAEALRSGSVSGEEAIKMLQQTYTTEASINTALTRVRIAILDGPHCPEYDDSILRSFNDPEIDALLDMRPHDQYRLQRQHASHPTWGDEKEAALARLRILPPACDTFCLTKQQTIQLKRKREDSQIKKNESLIRIDAPTLLRVVTTLLEDASPTTSFAKLILPLLVASGRRLTEICNGRSTFTAVDDTEYACIFDGQLKKRGKATPYRIPLLVPFPAFTKALRALRTKQGAIQELTNAQVKNRYQGNTQNAIAVILPMPKGVHIHDLRSTYMAFVSIQFRSPYTFARTAMLCLGHDTLLESLVYNNVVLDNADALRGSLGELKIH